MRYAVPAVFALVAFSAWAVRAQTATDNTFVPRLEIATDARPETVFQWATQRCAEMNVPDSPARAMRTAEGVLLLAAHFINIPLLGKDFQHLSPRCDASSQGAEAEDPARFQDRFWVQSLLPLPSSSPGRPGRIVGLASHEYMGWRHPGRCRAPFDGAGRRPAAFRCWYSAITAVTAEEGDWRFRPVPDAAGRGEALVVAASPYPYDAAATARTGFFSVSNAVIEGQHAFALVYTEGIPGQPRGNCLLRAGLSELIGGWRLLLKGDYPQVSRAATEPVPLCDALGSAVFGSAPIRSILRVPGTDGPWWIAVFTRGAPRGAASGVSEGVFYSRSRDLQHWSAAEQLWVMHPFRSQPEAGVYYEYPSLVDHASASPVFDRLADDPRRAELHLYLTRLNLMDRRRGLDRDLVRIPVRFSP